MWISLCGQSKSLDACSRTMGRAWELAPDVVKQPAASRPKTARGRSFCTPWLNRRRVAGVVLHGLARGGLAHGELADPVGGGGAEIGELPGIDLLVDEERVAHR